MTVSFAKLRKLIHRKSFEFLTVNPFGNTAAGTFIVGDDYSILPDHTHMYFVGGASAIYRYNADEDSWLQLPNSGIAGAFAAGACGEFRAMAAPGGVQTLTATGGTTNTIITNLTITRSLAGHRVRVVAGPGAGFDGTVLWNTLGANATLTLSGNASAAITAASQFQLMTGSLWFFNAGSSAVGFSVYDVATNTWTSRSVTGLPTAWGTDGQLIGTGSPMSNYGAGFDTGTATAGAATTLTRSTAAWPVNGWTNCQVRITGGTGAGQIRTIASNTATVLTVSTAWTTNPDATSTFVIEGNDDFMYLLGNNAVTMYRYQISTNTWSTLSPTAARAGAPGAGMMSHYIDNVPNWGSATTGVYGTHHSAGLIRQMGRYIYSFRGGSSSTLDVYDIAANTWISGVSYGAQNETFTTGSSSADVDGKIYMQKDATGRYFYFDISENRLEPLATSPMPQSTAVAGCKTALMSFKEGTETGKWLYALGNTRSELIRAFLV